MEKIKELIANWKLRRERKRNGLCPKHGTPMQTHGYFDETVCPDCFAENDKRWREEGL